MAELLTLDDAAALVRDGMKLAITGQTEMAPAAFARALVRNGVRDLDLVVVPTGGGYAVDLLLGAGCARSVEFAQIACGEYGLCPAFRRLAQEGGLAIRDHVCNALLSALQAAAMGIPFIPVRGIIGTDYLRVRPDFKVVPNPYGDENDRDIVIVPAIAPDIGVFHGYKADRDGNVLVDPAQNCALLAQAATVAIATVEEIVDENLLDTPHTFPVVSGLHVAAVVHAPRGAWPLACPGYYPLDAAHVQEYLRLAKTDDGLARYIERYVHAESAVA